MATIGPTDYGAIRDYIYRQGAGKEELKALTAGVPSKADFTAIFQAIEDRMSAGAVLAKADIETILGVGITAAFLKKLVAGWLAWKVRQ